MKMIDVQSDYTSDDKPNILRIIKDDQGDIHISVMKLDPSERGIRIAVSGTRHKFGVRKAFYDLVEAIEKERAEPKEEPL